MSRLSQRVRHAVFVTDSIILVDVTPLSTHAINSEGTSTINYEWDSTDNVIGSKHSELAFLDPLVVLTPIVNNKGGLTSFGSKHTFDS